MDWRILVGLRVRVAIDALLYKARDFVGGDGHQLLLAPLVARPVVLAGEALHEHPHLGVVHLLLALFATAAGLTTGGTGTGGAGHG